MHFDVYNKYSLAVGSKGLGLYHIGTRNMVAKQQLYCHCCTQSTSG